MKKIVIGMFIISVLLCIVACQSQLSDPNQNRSSEIEEENNNTNGNHMENDRDDGLSNTSASNPDEATGVWIRGNVLNGETGNIHYSYYLPDDYDGSKTYPMIMTLPGYGGMWFGENSEGNNLRETGVSIWTEMYEAMIIVSPQVED